MNAPTTNTLPSAVMGKTIERVKVQNIEDLTRVSRGELKEEDVRTVEFDALVDTGASHLCLPPDLIEKLGLPYSRTKNVQTANGVVSRRQFRAAQITIRDRSDDVPIMENDAFTPPLIGNLVLEMLDFVVNPKSQQLMGNPEHNRKWITDML